MQFSNLFIFFGILLAHPNDVRRSDRNMEVINNIYNREHILSVCILDSLHECKDINDSARRRYAIVSLGKLFWTSRVKL